MQLERFLFDDFEYCMERNPCLQPKWHTFVILHLPTIMNHCVNSIVQQKEEGLVSSTNLFILTKKVIRLTITNQFNSKQFDSNLYT